MTGTSLSAFPPSAHPNAQPSSVSLTDVTVLAPAVPAELTPILGREEALAALAARLADSRLLTLTGTGGCGKTRLALAVAHELLRGSLLLVPAPRIGWVEFAQLESGVHLPTTIAATMGLVVPPERDATEAIILASQAAPWLLVLDNCEHLLGHCATLVTRLLLSAPTLRIIATSREPLGVPGEVTWAVTPLPVPGDGSSALTPGAAMEIPSVRLFVERARDALPHFTLNEANVGDVAQLCRRLDGLPLAIELAAARVRALGPSQLLARADALLPLLRRRGQGAAARHRALEATLDWSYRLLTPDEQRLLRALSVFAGPFTLDAVERLVAALAPPARPATDSDPLDLLAALVERSLVMAVGSPDAPRYRLLETVRQYARQRLRDSGEEAEALRAHAERAAGYAEWAAVQLAGNARARTVREVDAEFEDLRQALDWAAATPGLGGAAARIAASLWIYFLTSWRWRDGARWSTAALDALRRDGDTGPWHARALYAATLFTWIVDPAATLAAQAEEMTARAEADGDIGLIALAYALHARVLLSIDHGRAAAMCDRAVAAARRLPASWIAAHAIAGADGFVGRITGDLERARRGNAEAEPIWRRVDDPWGLMLLWTEEALVALAESRWRDAIALMHRLLDAAADEPSWLQARALEISACAFQGLGDALTAARLVGGADRAREQVGNVRGAFEAAEHSAARTSLRDALGDDAFDAAWRDGHARPARALLAAATDGLPSVEMLPPVEEEGTWPLPDLGLLGSFSLRIDGVEQPSGVWPYAKPRELCAYLACHPEGRSKEQIGLALWPDVSPAQLRNNLHVTLHHARRALGDQEWVLYEHGRYHLAVECGLTTDRARFLDALRQARDAARAGDTTARRDALRHAISEWRGEFCEHEQFGAWAEDERDRLRLAYHDALLALGALEEAAGQLEEALATYERAVREDPLWEAVQRGLLRVLQALGRRGEAQAQGRRLKERLAREFAVEPEPQTAALLASLGVS